MTYPTRHKKLISWVEEIAKLTTPDRIHWCDGSEKEYDELCQLLVDAGTFKRLSADQATEQLLRDVGPRVTSRASRTARSSAPRTSTTPVRPTTGASRARCARS